MGLIIMIAGEAEAGKDTVGIIIDELWKELHQRPSSEAKLNVDFYNEFKTVKFADPINKAICAITGFSLEYVTNKDNYSKPIAWVDNKTLRDLKQQIGEGMKSILGEKVWIKSSFAKVTPHDFVKVTDLRFPKEEEFAEELKAIMIFVIRPGHIAETLNDSNREHTSEISVSKLDKSKYHILRNDGSRKQLKNRLRGILEKLEVWRTGITTLPKNF